MECKICNYPFLKNNTKVIQDLFTIYKIVIQGLFTILCSRIIPIYETHQNVYTNLVNPYKRN